MYKKNKKFGIYVHIPFCVSKCEYCSFVSICASDIEIQNYINFLCDEILLKASYYKNKKVSSIYFGGGTPSYIEAKYIQKVLKTINENYDVLECAEISIECNPCSTTKEKLEIYKSAGINRISFGVQSMNDNLLKLIGRKHTKLVATDAINTAKEVGFKNISADLMIGIPNQTKEDLVLSVEKLVNLNVTHISAYMLMLEENTPLFNKVMDGELSVARDDECVEMYNLLVKKLKSYEFNRYEISNFCKKNFECKHNVNYWDMGEYLGFGVASHSFVDKVRFSNFENFEDYYKSVEILKNIEKNLKNNEKTLKNDYFLIKNIYQTHEKLKNKEIIEETIMLGLRQTKGVCVDSLNKLGYDILQVKNSEISSLQEQNIIEIENGHIKLNPKHFGVCSAVVLELI